VVTGMTDTDPPQLFGLAGNIEGSVQQTQSSAVIQQLRKLAVSDSFSSKFDRTQWRAQLAPLLQLWEKITSKNDKLALRPLPRLSKEAKGEQLSPVESFVVLECQAAHDLITLVNDGLTALSNVVFASGLLTPTIRDDGTSLMSNSLPWRWQKYWNNCDDPATWLREIVKRKIALRGWMDKVEAGTLLTQPIILPELFRPRTFLNALRQQTARSTGTPIDELRLAASWSAVLLPKSATVRVNIEGLMIQCCGFQKDLLSPLAPDAPSMSPITPCIFAYIGKNEKDPYHGDDDSLAVPVYFSPNREDFICELKMPCRGGRTEWILSGAALFLTDLN